MITLKDRLSGFKVIGEHVTTTTDHFVLEINGVTQMFRIGEWEEVRDDQNIKRTTKAEVCRAQERNQEC